MLKYYRLWLMLDDKINITILLAFHILLDTFIWLLYSRSVYGWLQLWLITASNSNKEVCIFYLCMTSLYINIKVTWCVYCKCNLLVVDGGWSPWTTWSDCSVTCSNGTRYRRRSCDNPPPQHGGMICTDHGTEEQFCYPRECPSKGPYIHFQRTIFKK